MDQSLHTLMVICGLAGVVAALIYGIYWVLKP